jgi:hypothetical protein
MTISIVLDYAALGFQVFPLKPQTKEPATRRGFYEATNNPATLRRWFGGAYPYNIGIRTGIASGAWVFDVDGEAGALSLARLEAEHGELPPTPISTTSGGCHFWFKAVEPIPGSIGKIGAGLDVKAEDGYVVAPGRLCLSVEQFASDRTATVMAYQTGATGAAQGRCSDFGSSGVIAQGQRLCARRIGA